MSLTYQMETLRSSLPTRPLWQKLAPWAAGLILVAGVIAVLVKVVPNTSGTNDKSATPNPVVVRRHRKTVKLPKAARKVAGRFILTAVRRQHLDEAWKISGP